MDEAAGDDRPSRPWGPVLVVAAVVFVVDQLTKWLAVDRLADGPVELIGSLRFNLVHNRGGSFSIGGDGGWGPVLSLLALAVIGFLLWQTRSMVGRAGAIALGMVLGGAAGNLADRLARGDDPLHGAVVDFIDLQWWPVFNVADIGVVVGGLLLVVIGMRPTLDHEP